MECQMNFHQYTVVEQLAHGSGIYLLRNPFLGLQTDIAVDDGFGNLVFVPTRPGILFLSQDH